jgi:hypothetical protein
VDQVIHLVPKECFLFKIKKMTFKSLASIKIDNKDTDNNIVKP